ncbi:unnamed protein product [Owenia fusiformis]|uniref:Uncharacterized protein n=1 Tax=Owenia fusiformis TaxID=6347 RepID=A0A8J1XWW6_OWEFU|nr:unnamed protein product [Owenia fusiformis]
MELLQLVWLLTGTCFWWKFCACGASKRTLSPEQRLLKDLKMDYDTNIIPSYDGSQLRVTMDMALNQIVDVNEKNQMIITSVWLRFAWVDEYLQWNETEYGGVSKVHFPPSEIWVPDITLYDDVGGQYYDTVTYRVMVYSNGAVYWNIPARLQSSCKMDVRFFPYDTQKCRLKFGSWGYDGLELDLVNKSSSADIAPFMDNGEWFLKRVSAEQNILYYGCCVEPYPDVTYYIIIQRRPLYYVFNLLLPCVFIMGVTPFSFLASPASGERISLTITCLLALTVFLLFVAETLPPQSEVLPLVGVYFAVAIADLALASLAAIISVHLYHRGHRRDVLPKWAKSFFHGLAYLMCVGDRYPDKSNKKKMKEYDNKALDITTEETILPNGIKDTCIVTNGFDHKQQQTKHDTKTDNKLVSNKYDKELMDLIRDIDEHLKRFQEQREKAKRKDENKKDWKMASNVFDRFLFFVFLLFTICASIFFLVYEPRSDV